MLITTLTILALSLTNQVDAAKFSFEKTFKPPNHDGKLHSDDCEILERSNFSREDEDDIALRFGNIGVEDKVKRTQLVHYPFMFNTPCCNSCCNRDKEITVRIKKNPATATTQKPEIFCFNKEDDGVSELSDKELRFLSDYLDDVDDVGTWDYLDKSAKEKPSETDEEIVIKIVEKSPPCKNFGTVSDKLDFIKVKVSDVVNGGGQHVGRCSCNSK